jgi:hypothetical protein
MDQQLSKNWFDEDQTRLSPSPLNLRVASVLLLTEATMTESSKPKREQISEPELAPTTAFARHGHHLRQRRPSYRGGRLEPKAAELPARREHRRRSITNRISWILAGMLLGATAGWAIFQAFLTLITLD